MESPTGCNDSGNTRLKFPDPESGGLGVLINVCIQRDRVGNGFSISPHFARVDTKEKMITGSLSYRTRRAVKLRVNLISL